LFDLGISTVVQLSAALPRDRQRGSQADGRRPPFTADGRTGLAVKREAGELDLTIEELRDKLKARGVIVGGSSSRSCCSTVTRPNDRLARSPDPSL
jgi:hypothetical protein